MIVKLHVPVFSLLSVAVHEMGLVPIDRTLLAGVQLAVRLSPLLSVTLTV
jgi:hypothetical protein